MVGYQIDEVIAKFQKKKFIKYILIWVCDLTHRHIRVEPKVFKMADEVYNPPLALEARYYPVRIAKPSCIKLPNANGNNFKLKSNYIS